jgi:hypothetical protein
VGNSERYWLDGKKVLIMARTQKTNDGFCDFLAAYEMNLLSEQERTGFENHLPQCSDCLDELYAMAPEIAEMTSNPGVYAHNAGLEMGERSLRSRLSRIFVTGPGRVVVPMVMAAIIAVLMFLPQPTPHKYQNLVIMDAPAYSPIQIRAGHQQPWHSPWERGMEHYQNGEFDSAAEGLSLAVNLLSTQTEGPGENQAILDNARLYLGVSRIMSGNGADSFDVLTEAAASSILPIHQKSLWYLAQAHLLADQPEAAIEVLNKLLNSPVFGSRAATMVEEIQSLMTE